MTKRVLLVVDAYPPDKGGRAEKVERRVRYLTQNGWEVDVLAPLSSVAQSQREILSVNGHVVRVVRTNYLLRSRWPSLKHNKARPIDTNRRSIIARWLDLVFVPKGYVRWFPFAVIHGFRLARKADLILSISNPITLHLIGLIFHVITRKPWAIELRDAIVNYEYSRRGPELINRLLEQIFVHFANRIFFWQDTGIDDISNRYPLRMKDKFVGLFPIGYDPSRFSTYQNSIPQRRNVSRLVCTYTGSFYGDAITPRPILQALAHCVESHGLKPEEIQLWFAGDWSDSYDELAANLGLRDYVSYKGWLSHDECLDLWSASDVLLLLLGEREAHQGLIPTKLWDYIAAKRPILCLAPPQSRISHLIIEHGLGEVVASSDISAISSALLRLLSRKRDKMHSNQHGWKVESVERWSCVPMETLIAQTLSELVGG